MNHEQHVRNDKRHYIPDLKSTERQRDQILTIVAHELSNPLAAVAYSAELLRRRDITLEAREKAAAIILEQTEFMRRLVEDIRDLSGVRRDNVDSRDKTPIDLAQVARHAAEMSRPLIEQHEHALEIVMPGSAVRIQGESLRLAQIVTNLLTNAARYTPNGGHIRLSIEQEADTAVLKVKDNGIGIPREMLTHVFDPFTRLEDGKQIYASGMGIGLAFVRNLAEIHRGSVEAFSEGEGHGSEFVVRLPLAKDEPLSANDVTADKQEHCESLCEAKTCAMFSPEVSAAIRLEAARPLA